MRLSTRGQYGVRALVQLAANYDKGPMPLREISKNENISYQYLEQIFLDLKKDELVRSVRGARGGYSLAKDPKEITVGDIIRSLEGPIGPVDCVKEEDSKSCERSSICVSRNVWKKLRDRMTEVLDEFTLKDLTETYE
ncbi:RrF2 family transcriptional regulator [Natranaerofaba carboxydovora]|uniref:RrF2 family transcriptional regulator n=1 Tax=Natranaerofaba carboxydovora TaxID=2742683 RepID=UPI001F13B073|nr:Rrf2 family transcriptional regulator [Natranaerofaba carboxydovora]UMZ74893.1 HTH-type transcriptional regulator CymR [Natranaerofaba carboxydovora]